MRILIEKEFKLKDLNEVDFEFLKACTIFHSLEEDYTNILEQKVDLSEYYMEEFLTLVDFCGDRLIKLSRYGHGRYSLMLGNL